MALPTFTGFSLQDKPASRTPSFPFPPPSDPDEKQINRNQHVAVNTQREECISVCVDMDRKRPGVSVEGRPGATAGRAKGQRGTINIPISVPLPEPLFSISNRCRFVFFHTMLYCNGSKIYR